MLYKLLHREYTYRGYDTVCVMRYFILLYFSLRWSASPQDRRSRLYTCIYYAVKNMLWTFYIVNTSLHRSIGTRRSESYHIISYITGRGILFSFQLLRWRIEDIAFYLLYTNVIFLGYGVFCLVVRWRLKIMMHCWGMWQKDISSWLFILCPRVNILCSNCVQTVKCGYSNGIGAVWGCGRRWASQPGQFLRILRKPVAVRDGSKVPPDGP